VNILDFGDGAKNQLHFVPLIYCISMYYIRCKIFVLLNSFLVVCVDFTLYLRVLMVNYSEIVAKVKPSIAFISVMKGSEFISQGTGFVMFKPGMLVTCNHVVPEPHTKILLFFPDKPNAFKEAKILTRQVKYDIAILEFEDPDQLSALELNDEPIKEGMPVLFMGYPLGLRTFTAHQGILSAITKDATGIETYFIDGTVHQGNSGAPLLSAEGKVIGVITATKREEVDLLDNVSKMETGILSLHGIDLIEVYQALIKNLQLGIGFAVPCAYIPKQ
jgi:S1-C subfamily serine protease